MHRVTSMQENGSQINQTGSGSTFTSTVQCMLVTGLMTGTMAMVLNLGLMVVSFKELMSRVRNAMDA